MTVWWQIQVNTQVSHVDTMEHMLNGTSELCGVASKSPPKLWCSSLGALHVKGPFMSFPFLSFLSPCWAKRDEKMGEKKGGQWTMILNLFTSKNCRQGQKGPTFTINPNVATVNMISNPIRIQFNSTQIYVGCTKTTYCRYLTTCLFW